VDVTRTARTLVGSVAGAADRVLSRGGTDEAPQQTLTFTSSPAEVLAAARDAAVWSQVLGEFGSVSADGPGRYRFTTPHGPEGGTPTELRETGDLLQFQRGGEDGPIAELHVHQAPQDRGTEVQLRLDVPAPDLAAGAATFTVLYRLRALLQTGEVPTITPQPSARPAER